MKKKPSPTMKRKLQKSGETGGTVLHAACVISASVALAMSGRTFLRSNA